MNILGTHGKHSFQHGAVLRQQKRHAVATRLVLLLSAKGFCRRSSCRLLRDFRSRQYLTQAHQKMLLYYTISATKNCRYLS